MKKQGLWVRWLEVLAALIAVNGLALAVLGGTSLIDPMRDLVDPVFWDGGGPSAATQDFQTWIYAVLGGSMVGWGIALVALARYGLGGGHRWAWWTFIILITAWYIPDTAASAIADAWFNVVGNTAILVAAAIPLVGLRELRRG